MNAAWRFITYNSVSQLGDRHTQKSAAVLDQVLSYQSVIGDDGPKFTVANGRIPTRTGCREENIIRSRPWYVSLLLMKI